MDECAARFPAKLKRSTHKNRRLDRSPFGYVPISGSNRRRFDDPSGPVEGVQFTHGLSRRNVEIHETQGRDPGTHGFGKIVGGFHLAYGLEQYLARLLFYQTAARVRTRRFTSLSRLQMVTLAMMSSERKCSHRNLCEQDSSVEHTAFFKMVWATLLPSCVTDHGNKREYH
jgi:hypothetical protein